MEGLLVDLVLESAPGRLLDSIEHSQLSKRKKKKNLPLVAGRVALASCRACVLAEWGGTLI